jgi:ribulose-5-phosphate 4-epimerase/fuculose-1-phosphate aldolase
VRPEPAIVETFLRYARLLAARGYVHNTLGNIVIRVPQPGFPHGVAYTKHAELSLEEMGPDNRMLMTMISRPASQNCGVPNSIWEMLRCGPLLGRPGN